MYNIYRLLSYYTSLYYSVTVTLETLLSFRYVDRALVFTLYSIIVNLPQKHWPWPWPRILVALPYWRYRYRGVASRYRCPPITSDAIGAARNADQSVLNERKRRNRRRDDTLDGYRQAAHRTAPDRWFHASLDRRVSRNVCFMPNVRKAGFPSNATHATQFLINSPNFTTFFTRCATYDANLI